MGKETLIFIVSCFPFGRHESFIENEILTLSESYSKVIVMPQIAVGNMRPTPPNVVTIPMPQLSRWQKFFYVFMHAFFNRMLWQNFHEIFHGRNPFFRLQMLFSYVGLAAIYSKHIRKKVISSVSGDFTVYSYWMDRGGVAAAMLQDCAGVGKIVSRAHGFDIYEERNTDSYLPLRKEIISRMDCIYPISLHGLDYLNNRYGGIGRFKVSRLGTICKFHSNVRTIDGVFNMLSVSNVIPLKRVDLIAQSVAELASQNSSGNFFWCHIGDGVDFERLKEKVKEINLPNLKISLPGAMMNSEVIEYYRKNNVNLFINLSTSEGIPVSFMEAMSFATPVLATNVGGVSEIIDNECGYLLPESVTSNEVAKVLSKICNDPSGLMLRSRCAIEKWRKYYDASFNYPEFCHDLKKVSDEVR